MSEIIFNEETQASSAISNTSSISSLPVRRRLRDEVSLCESIKIYKNSAEIRIIKKKRMTEFYLKLKSGEEFNFTESDGKNILLNETLEPNRLVRNIISKIPVKVRERIIFLEKFMSDKEDTDDDDDDADNPEETLDKIRFLNNNLQENIYTAYIREWRLRYLFKRFLNMWRIYKMNKICEKELDPITLSEPEKEIYIYDWHNRKKFIFDAKSLATLIESKLLYNEHGFPVPILPKNPKNNVEFTYKQLISLYYQLKEYGELRWAFTTLREFDFNKKRWYLYHKSALTMNSIRNNISLVDSAESRELFMDFIFGKMDDLGINYSDDLFDAYKVALIKVPTHWYFDKIKPIAILHYEAEHFGLDRYNTVNSLFLKVVAKQSIFIKDLRNKKII